MTSEKVSNARSVQKNLWILLGIKAENKNITRNEIATRVGRHPPIISDMLNGERPTNNLERYEQIAQAIWLTDKDFEKLLREARKKAYIEEVWEEDYEDLKIGYALKSEFPNSPEAIEEAESFISFLRSKYGE